MRHPQFGTGIKFVFSTVYGKAFALAAIAAVMIFAGSRQAQAQETMYTLNSVMFTDGEAATGYFDFNPTSTFMSSYSIMTTGGTLAPATYSYSGPGYSVGNDFIFQFGGSDAGPMPLATLVLDFSPNLTAFGPQNLVGGVYSGTPGTFSYSGEQEQTSNGKQIQDLMVAQNQVVNAGPLSVQVTPEPSSGLVMCLGLTLVMAGIAATRFRAKTFNEGR